MSFDAMRSSFPSAIDGGREEQIVCGIEESLRGHAKQCWS